MELGLTAPLVVVSEIIQQQYNCSNTSTENANIITVFSLFFSSPVSQRSVCKWNAGARVVCPAQLLGAVVTVAICLPLTTSTVTTVCRYYRGVWGQKTRCWLQMVTALPTPGPGRGVTPNQQLPPASRYNNNAGHLILKVILMNE